MSNLDQFAKGNTPGNYQPGVLPNKPALPAKNDSSPTQDSTVSLPSSPPKIYLNLLIMEASLRLQWLQLRARRRQHTFFLTLLALWVVYFGYALFLAPREDGSGVGGSVYWVVEVVEKLCLLGGVITGVLVWGTGQWERGIRWPRRWVYCTNRGLRGFNCKLVVIKQAWWLETYSMFSFLFSHGLFTRSSRSTYRYTEQSLLKEHKKLPRGGLYNTLGNKSDLEIEGYEEDLEPGGDYIKLLLLPKSFSAKFREDWDIYRTEYWEKENERRAIIRKSLQERERKIAKQQGGHFWWIGFRGWSKTRSKTNEKTGHSLHKHSPNEREKTRFRSTSLRSIAHSRASSQDVAATAEVAQKGHIRGGSSISKFPGKRRKGASSNQINYSSRPFKPEHSSPLSTQSSLSSFSSIESL
ncbi:Sporulation-specific protein SPO7 [Erysiphe neolycopersici]|uniref:Sporulation-specific protein SPO7 n=1 Tax=Erysiphe neolycopersici TaxID=212602 RepID=A0A420HV75_9PEZI|nr:Sporulation-specific protein SPO7 [Erysiphe neolycopersici]